MNTEQRSQLVDAAWWIADERLRLRWDELRRAHAFDQDTQEEWDALMGDEEWAFHIALVVLRGVE